MRSFRLNLSDSEWESEVGHCEYGNEPRGSMNCGEFIDNLSEY
jgi:hypothetical protein